MNDPEQLYWCHQCWAWRPPNHEPRRAPLRIRAIRKVKRWIEQAEYRVAAWDTHPGCEPPRGYERVGNTTMARRVQP